jgi:hypothetical protein
LPQICTFAARTHKEYYAPSREDAVQLSNLLANIDFNVFVLIATISFILVVLNQIVHFFIPPMQVQETGSEKTKDKTTVKFRIPFA